MRTITNYLQPADNFVQRPPLDLKLASPLLCLAIIAWICSIVVIGWVSHREAHRLITHDLPSCELPGAGASCNETTSYPKHVIVFPRPWHSIELVIHSRLSTLEVKEAIRGMTCQLNSSTGHLTHITGFPNMPIDFRRSCVNPIMPQIELRPILPDFNYDAIYDHLKLLKRLREETPYWNRIRCELSGFSVQRYYWDDVWLGVVGARLLFVDGSEYEVSYAHHCDGPDLDLASYHVQRNCLTGAPYLNATASLNPELCSDNYSAISYALELLDELLSDPSWYSEVAEQYYQIAGRPENASIFPAMAYSICHGGALPVSELLGAVELGMPNARSTDELIDVVAQKLDLQCPYSFECNEKHFEGEFMWLAVAYPILVIVASVFNFALRHAYVALHGIRAGGSTTRDSQLENQNDQGHVGSSSRSRGPDADVNSSKEALELAKGLDLAVLRQLPHTLSMIEKRLLQLESLSDSRGAQVGNASDVRLEEPSQAHEVSRFGVGATLQCMGEEQLKPSLGYKFEDSCTNEQQTIYEMLANVVQEVQQTWRDELNVAMRSCTEDIANLKAGLDVLERESLTLRPNRKLICDGNGVSLNKIATDAQNPCAGDADDALDHYPKWLNEHAQHELNKLRMEIADISYHVDSLSAVAGAPRLRCKRRI